MALDYDEERVQCIRCGEWVRERSLNSHQRTRKCAHAAGNKRVRNRGFTMCTGTQVERLRLLGIRLIEVPPEKAKWDSEWYAPPWTMKLLTIEYAIPREFRSALPDFMAYVRDNPKVQTAIAALTRLGGGRAALVGLFKARCARSTVDELELPVCNAREFNGVACGGKVNPEAGWDRLRQEVLGEDEDDEP